MVGAKKRALMPLRALSANSENLNPPNCPEINSQCFNSTKKSLYSLFVAEGIEFNAKGNLSDHIQGQSL